MNIRRIAAAASFATGAALAFAPLALADSSSDAASVVDSLISGVSPADTTPINLDISFDGYTLYDGMGTAVANTGTAGNGLYDFAIAYGDGAHATALGGTGDYALASGTDANAEAGSLASGATGNNFDTAEDIGNNVGPNEGAYAGNASLIGGTDDVATSSNDSAYDFGNNAAATTGTYAGDGNDGAFAGSAGLIGASGAGNGDTAYDVGNNTGFGLGPASVDGTGDYASQNGDYGTAAAPVVNEGALAGFGNYDVASVVGGTSSATAGGGYEGPLSNFDIATVYDPSGALGSGADAGALGDVAGNYDFAGAFADHLNALAQGADYLFTTLPSLF
jgi:hypothetical protein